MIIDEEVYLKHHGVKGMKWGQRRKQKRQARFEANHKKAMELVTAATKKPNDLFLLNGRTVVTGKEFTDHMVSGGLLDVKSSRPYAKFDAKKKTYVMQ